MGRAGRAESDTVIEDLLDHPHRFEFFQAVRLLRLAVEARDDGPRSEIAPLGRIRFTATPTMGFPATDITAIAANAGPDGRQSLEVEVPFLGLYGPSSPLPAFVTEHVIARDRDNDALRDFLDLFNHRSVELLYAIWRKYRHSVTYRTGGTDPISRYVIALMGLLSLGAADNELSLESLLPFAGPLAVAGHSAPLLASLVSRQFGGVPVHVEEFVPRRATVDDAQKARLGVRNATLGDDWVLGGSVPDLTGKFLLWIGPVGIDRYRAFLPGLPDRKRLSELVDATVRTRLDYDVMLIVRDDEVPDWRLGQSGKLGHDAWLAHGETVESTILSAA